MKIFFDQGVPKPLKKIFEKHKVSTAYEMTWSQLSNGELINKCEINHYDLFISTDQSLQYQQNLENRKIAIIILMTTSWPRIKLSLDAVLSAVKQSQSEEFKYQEIDF